MQKVIRKTALARNQAQRKAILGKKGATREELKLALQDRFKYDRVQIDRVRAERQHRQEDWLRGPLAPQRDTGVEGMSFGAIDPQTMHLPKVRPDQRRKFINFAVRDRVCITKGRDKGKISEVTEVNAESESVIVKDLNVADVAYPKWLNEQYGSKAHFQTVSMPIPMDDVRLVVALDDPDSGTTRDYVAEHVYGAGPFYEREYGTDTPRHSRYIAGVDIDIPWPSPEAPNHKDEDWDTLRMEVETPTWMPSLKRPPFPSSVIDELRNKYSKFRTRHDPEYVKQKKMEEYKQEYLANRTLLTPRGELTRWIQMKKQESMNSRRDAEGNLIMQPKTVDFIQSFMEGNKGKKGKSAA
ncbi:KOW motif domain protein [Aspergillus sp. HF37]|nr:KOW motif domain protein [Aspergillus sp. HF37]